MKNDFPVFRFAKVLMMKAEALWRLGRDAEALGLINLIRKRANLPDLVLLNDDIWIQELGREFFMEAHRRTDLIRFGQFQKSWWEKPASEDCKELFPIPQSQFEAGSNLKQNPCY
jgi:hypothetical protein